MPSCTCVAILNTVDFEGFFDLLTTINKYQTLYFSFVDIKNLHSSSGGSPTSEPFRAEEFLRMIKISKSARCVKIDLIHGREKTETCFGHLAVELLGCDKLEILQIPHCTVLFNAAVATMKSLRVLSCSTVALHVFNAIPEGLESLHIETGTDNLLEISKSLKRLTSLRDVNIMFSDINEETIIALMKSLSHCHQLETLRLGSWKKPSADYLELSNTCFLDQHIQDSHD